MNCYKCNRELTNEGHIINTNGIDNFYCDNCFEALTKQLKPKEKKIKNIKELVNQILIYSICVLSVISIVISSITLSKILGEQVDEGKTMEQIAKEALVVGDVELESESYSDEMYCYVENKTSKDLDFVRIDVLCYDSAGNYIGSASFYESYLPAKENIELDGYPADETETCKIIKVEADYADYNV